MGFQRMSFERRREALRRRFQVVDPYRQQGGENLKQVNSAGVTSQENVKPDKPMPNDQDRREESEILEDKIGG